MQCQVLPVNTILPSLPALGVPGSQPGGCTMIWNRQGKMSTSRGKKNISKMHILYKLRQEVGFQFLIRVNALSEYWSVRKKTQIDLKTQHLYPRALWKPQRGSTLVPYANINTIDPAWGQVTVIPCTNTNWMVSSLKKNFSLMCVQSFWCMENWICYRFTYKAKHVWSSLKSIFLNKKSKNPALSKGCVCAST